MDYADSKQTENNFKGHNSIQVKRHIGPNQIKKQTAKTKFICYCSYNAVWQNEVCNNEMYEARKNEKHRN